jgi:hypothetical protein
MSAAEWNKRVDAFDVPGLVKQLEATGCRYCVITLGQNSGHFCSPNAAYDKYAGIQPSKCSKRDLVKDIHAALAPTGIKLMLYLPCQAPNADPVAQKGFGLPHTDAGTFCVSSSCPNGYNVIDAHYGFRYYFGHATSWTNLSACAVLSLDESRGQP